MKGSKESLKLENIKGNLSGSGFDHAVSGGIGNFIAISGVDLKLKISGKDLAEIGTITGKKLPASDKFTLQGRLMGSTLDAKLSPDKFALSETGARALGSLAIGPLRLLAPFVHLGAHEKHPCNIQSIGQLGLQSPANE